MFILKILRFSRGKKGLLGNYPIGGISQDLIDLRGFETKTQSKRCQTMQSGNSVCPTTK